MNMLCFVFAILVTLLDQFIKRCVLLTLALNESRDLLPGIISLTNVNNPGAAFSMLAGQRWLLAGIAFVAVLLLIAILLRYNDGFWGTLGLSAVLGGALGNLIDRVSYGYVVDMFNLEFMHFYIFNIADIFITLGGITFLIHFIIITIKPKKVESVTYDDVPFEDSYAESPQVEDQIGLYDFHYGEETGAGDIPQYDDDSDIRLAPGSYPTPSASQSEYDPGFSPGEGALEAPDEYSSAIDALSKLEDELLETGALEDYDLDELLREYGFEDDTNQM